MQCTRKWLYLTAILYSHVNAGPYYQPANYGSESLYSPLGTFLSYSFDTLQLPDSFDTHDFDNRYDLVIEHLTHPRAAIDAEGGFNRFVNRQIFPVDSDFSSESWSILPNYGLHLLGGGIVYRKDLEWFRKHDVENATSYAISLAMTAELIQEVFEKKTTTDDDEVADVLIFRPLGIWLFHDDAFAIKFMSLFDPAAWSYLQAFDVSEDRFINTGINYVYRPPATQFYNSRLFIFTGLNNLIGLSHQYNNNEWFSWGMGLATQRVDFSLSAQAELEPSLGFFYDRNKSLLWSLVLNDTGGNNVRFNLFPTNQSLAGKFGYFVSSHEDETWSFGFTYRFPLGIGFTQSR